MCNCLTDIQKKISEKYPEWKGKKVISITPPTVFYIQNDKMVSGTSSDFDIKVEGIKKDYPVSIKHTFCPFCGVKYG